MSDYRVLVSCPLILDAIDEYEAELAAHGIEYDVADVDQHLSEDELLDVIDRYDGVIAGDDEFTERVIAAADGLQVIAKWGIGMDAIDLAAAAAHDVTVSNTPGAFADEVADVVIGYAITLARRLHVVDDRVRDGDWYCPRGDSLAGRTFGVVGVGNIGSAVARRADALGMDLLGHDVDPIPGDLVDDTGMDAVDLDTLLDRSDVVSLNCALTADTRGLIGEAELARLGEDGYLINTARGELVDQAALVAALRDGRLAGAGLDVFTEEPLPADSPLTEMDDVILGSHNAQNTHEAVEAVNDRAVRNLIEGLVDDS